MFSNIRKRDVFHPGMKYLYGRYCPCCCRDGMQNILASYKRKIKLVKKLLQSSNLVYCPAQVIIPSLITHSSPLRTSKTLSFLQSVKPNTSAIYIYMNIFYFICIYQYLLCLDSLYSCSATYNSYLSLHLPLLSIFFSCSSCLVSKISEQIP